MTASAGAFIRKYRIDPATIRPITRRRVLRRLAWVVPVLLIAMGGSFAIVSQGKESLFGLTALLSLLVGACGLALSAGLALRRTRRVLRTVEITLTEGGLRFESSETDPIEVPRRKIDRIVELAGDGLYLHTIDGAGSVLVSAQLEGFQELRAVLSQWRAIEPALRGRAIADEALTTIALIGCWLATGLVRDMAIATVAGFVVIGIACELLRRIFGDPAASRRYKLGATAVLGTLMLAPIARWILYFLHGSGGSYS